MSSLVGDCLLASSFLSYMGPFLSHYREELLNLWMTQVRGHTTHTHNSKGAFTPGTGRHGAK